MVELGQSFLPNFSGIALVMYSGAAKSFLHKGFAETTCNVSRTQGLAHHISGIHTKRVHTSCAGKLKQGAIAFTA